MSARPRRSAPCAALTVLVLLAAVGCLRPTKAGLSVSALSALFPVMDQLDVHSYMADPHDPDCVYFEYRRGSFTSNPSNEFCRTFEGPDDPAPVAFDPRATNDMASLIGEFERVGVPIEYLYISQDVAGAVGSGSLFAADRCVAYVYEPGWSSLPEDIPGESVSTAISADWHKTDNCP